MTDNPVEDFLRYDRVIAKKIRGHCVNCGCPLYIGQAAYIDNGYNLYCDDCVDNIRFERCHGCDIDCGGELFETEECERADIKFDRIWIDDE